MKKSNPKMKNAMLMAPIAIPAIAKPRPVEFGACRICVSAIAPRITAIIPGTGTPQNQPNIRLTRPTTNDAVASPGGGGLTCGWGGGGGGSQGRATGCGGCHGRSIGARSSGAIQPPAAGESRGSHCVDCSEGSSTLVSRTRGSQFGSAGGVRSSLRRLPSLVQKVSQASEYCLLH
jgi:hypothetical protein